MESGPGGEALLPPRLSPTFFAVAPVDLQLAILSLPFLGLFGLTLPTGKLWLGELRISVYAAVNAASRAARSALPQLASSGAVRARAVEGLHRGCEEKQRHRHEDRTNAQEHDADLRASR